MQMQPVAADAADSVAVVTIVRRSAQSVKNLLPLAV